MATDAKEYKGRLFEYLQRRGVVIDTSKSPPVITCPEPSHADKHPSAVIYQRSAGDDTDSVYCPVCATSWDIFEVAGLLGGHSSFIDQKNDVLHALGDANWEAPKAKASKTSAPKMVPVSYEKAKKIFNLKDIQRIADGMNKGQGLGKFIKAWPYKNASGDIELIDVRFETEEKKNILSIYYDGRSMRLKSYPIVLYNRDVLASRPDDPVMIHEGAKACDAAAEALPGYVHMTWNGGGKKSQLADWSPLLTHTVIMWPDDDPPGVEAAHMVENHLPGVAILPPFLPSREIKPKGADIVEALGCASVEDIREFIKTAEPLKPLTPETPPTEPHRVGDIPDQFPFRVLGVADDGKAYFIDRHGRLFSSALETLSEKKLIRLAGLAWWKNEVGFKLGKDEWTNAFDMIIETAGKVDFDLDKLRGRGAWREGDGSLCYHDGEMTIGEYDPGRIFLRVPRQDIGLGDNPATPEICVAVRRAVEKMSFTTQADAMRALAWSVLAPFSGALKIRPAGLLTGPSGSGKTTLLDEVLKPIAAPFVANAQDSSVAGIRQKINHDSCGVALEEAEAGDDTRNKGRNEFFSLMRVSFSDDAPDAYKGTQDQTGRSFKMKNMFLFISISPEVDEVADDKRIFRINMVQGVDGWESIQAEIKGLVTEPTCRAIRSRAWKCLPAVMVMADRVKTLIQSISGLDPRTSYAEAMLISAYFIVWNNAGDIEPDKLEEKIRAIYKLTPVEDHRDETEEMVDRLLDETVPIPNTRGVKMTLREIMTCIITGQKDNPAEEDDDGREYVALSRIETSSLKKVAGNYGLGVLKGSTHIAIAINHHEVKKITGSGTGYHQTLFRHSNYRRARNGNTTELVSIAGKTRRCVIIADLIETPDGVPF